MSSDELNEIQFSELPEFQREFKKFSKKYKSLPRDLEEFQKIIAEEPIKESQNFTVLTRADNGLCIVKARFFCDYLKGNNKLRIIYAYVEEEQKIEFLEMYFKGEKDREDRERIKEYIRGAQEFYD